MTNEEAREAVAERARQAETEGKDMRKQLESSKKDLEGVAQRYGVELDAEAVNDNAKIDTEADLAGKRFKDALKEILKSDTADESGLKLASVQDQLAEVQKTADKEATIEGSLMSMQEQMAHVQRVADAAPRPLEKPPVPAGESISEVADRDILDIAPAPVTAAESKPDTAAADAARLAELQAMEQKLMADYDKLAQQVATEAQFMTPDDAKAYKKALKTGDLSALPKATPTETVMNDTFKRLNALRAEKNALLSQQKTATPRAEARTETRAATPPPLPEKREVSPTDKMLSGLAPEVAAAAKRNYDNVDERANGGLIAKGLTPDGKVRATYADNTVLEISPDGSYSTGKLSAPEKPKSETAAPARESAPDAAPFDEASDIENGDLLTLEADRALDQKALDELAEKNDAISVSQREQLKKRVDQMNAAIDRKRSPDGLTKEIGKLQDRIDANMAKMVGLSEDQEAVYLHAIENLMSQVAELKKRRDRGPEGPDTDPEPPAGGKQESANEQADEVEPMMLEDDPRFREMFDKKARQLKAKGVDAKQADLEATEFAQTMFKKRFPDEAATYEERRKQSGADDFRQAA